MREDLETLAARGAEVSAAAAHCAAKLANKMLGLLKRGLARRFAQGAAAAAPDCGELAFDYYQALMGRYRTILLHYEAHTIPFTPAVGEILEGIRSVLLSQVRVCEEFLKTYPGDNPAAAEKKALVAPRARAFAKKLAAQAGAFRRAWLEGEPPAGFDPDRLAASLRDALRAQDFFYPLYAEQARQCAAALNDAEARPAAYFLFDQLAKERDSLRQMIKIQARALEDALAASGESEKALVNMLLVDLRETHQYLGRHAEEIEARFQQKPTALAEAKPEYLAYAEGLMAPEKFTAPKGEAYRQALAALEACAQAAGQAALAQAREADRKASAKLQYELRRLETAQLSIAQELTQIFAGIEPAAPPPGDPAEAEIVAGIWETVKIKLECLQESQGNFSETCGGVVEACRQAWEARTRQQADCPALARRLAEEALNGRPADPDALLAAEQAKLGLEPFGKLAELYGQKMKQQILAFYKNDLLYEIGTFEELLNYSVSRLRLSPDPAAQAYAARVDAAAQEIETVLKKNNIALIRPGPHEGFNGKEHEVLMAETREGFAKGEIIKTMNSGYRLADTVLVRANVIAAK
jgi:molecular chaperone GrpE (heat shock protein)